MASYSLSQAKLAVASLFELTSGDTSQVRERQNLALAALVEHVCARVPYYRALFRNAGLLPEDIQSVSDLKKIPVTTRLSLLEVPISERLAAGTELSELTIAKTSGSTGAPLLMGHSEAEEFVRFGVRCSPCAVWV